MADLVMYDAALVTPEFIANQIAAGNWIRVKGDINALNDTIEYIPAANKRFHLFEAKIVLQSHPTGAGSGTSTDNERNIVTADLLIDGTVEDTTSIGTSAKAVAQGLAGGGSGSGFGTVGDGRFNVAGLSLDGDGAKKVEIKNVLRGAENPNTYAMMSGWLEDI